jgi:hypothetical protein
MGLIQLVGLASSIRRWGGWHLRGMEFLLGALVEPWVTW